ncbi:imidazole glycerol phosphate synthase cyclase subunit [Campylobacter sp. VicNov18]|uniref:HisA/HisF-related TIM barrel protein n=1 Tax=Campylobacter bilis TaxID=2691918 RepID=UPI00130EE0E5|nr:HisA/HisF-related TIM barrel protein [Campylobacter bilis]MPV64225.1 imidazole glycerol phosphate synthase subunit HisF [Campylobacter hepaticus]MBM0637730.1 imidazole glycerol phosphate synthase subunit HisF [Campylobacter bilis]MCC8278455.1 imidazole glycerol phosphate synthase cyclase subunit [Campylobacter bilis]MCC8299959.1 imidazole glycerol phosphate synthase cyclase subunit [Campylobacter bilis]MCC8301364.1 imidazole glycerol phosphate synthase cyclase subunit [Campylobacter bilis]
MLKTRIIPCVLLKNGQLVKSIEFKDFRTIGHLTSSMRIYNARNVDELIILDIDASKNAQIDFESIQDLAKECFMPLTIGGGIKTLEDIQKILNLGADKIAINSQALKDPAFIAKAANRFGSQCIVCSIDVKRKGEQFCVYDKGNLLQINPLELALEYQKQGAGELLLTSVDFEGKAKGYDLELLKIFQNRLKIPLIINGGLSKPSDALKALNLGADALAGAYIFHFSQYTPKDIKEELAKEGFAVRLI